MSSLPHHRSRFPRTDERRAGGGGRIRRRAARRTDRGDIFYRLVSSPARCPDLRGSCRQPRELGAPYNTRTHSFGAARFPRLTPVALQSLLTRDDDYTMPLHVVWRYLLLSLGIRSYAAAPSTRPARRRRLSIVVSL